MLQRDFVAATDDLIHFTRMATAHLIHGFLGVGKTTFAKQLEHELPAVRFTHDEWMVRLYGNDPPADLFPIYASKVSEQMDVLWARCLELGLDVVLDLGFWTREERNSVRSKVQALGGNLVLYRIDCPEQTARQRLKARARNAGELVITEATYNLLRCRFEALGDDEARTEVEG